MKYSFSATSWLMLQFEDLRIKLMNDTISENDYCAACEELERLIGQIKG